jgi:hypothetical protein
MAKKCWVKNGIVNSNFVTPLQLIDDIHDLDSTQMLKQ